MFREAYAWKSRCSDPYMEISEQGLLGKRGYFHCQQMPWMTQRFILWFYRLVFKPVHIHLQSPVPTNREFTDLLRNLSHTVQRRICFSFVWLLHIVTMITASLEETLSSQSLLHLIAHTLTYRVEFYHTTFSLPLFFFSTFSLLKYFSSLKVLSTFSCSWHRNNIISLIQPFSIFFGPILFLACLIWKGELCSSRYKHMIV